MDDKLRQIVTRVEASKLADADKAKIYARISVGLESLVMPVLLAHMPKDQASEFISDPKNATIEKYISLMEETLKNSEPLVEIETWMKQMLQEVDAALE